MVFADVIGWAGTSSLIAGYVLVSSRGKPPGILFQCFNIFGGAGLIVNGVYHSAWPIVGLNVVWFTIGAVSLLQLLLKRRSTRLINERRQQEEPA